MRIVVISDSHRRSGNIKKSLTRSKAPAIFSFWGM